MINKKKEEIQEAAYQAWLAAGKIGTAEMATGCHALGAKILMYNGNIKNVEDIVVGEFLMGDDSTPRKVLRLISGSSELFKITTVKGEEIIVNLDHILRLYITPKRKGDIPKFENISVKDYLTKSHTYKHRAKIYKVEVDFEEKEDVLEPYLIGLWLGDGNSNTFCITNTDVEILEFLNNKSKEYNLGLVSNKITHCLTRGKSQKKDNLLRKILSDNDLLFNKHIPLNYKTASKQQRLQLLAGLMDSDGYLTPGGQTFEIVQKSKTLAEDIVYLSRSLGFLTTIKEKKIFCSNCSDQFESYIGYRVHISGNTVEIPTLVSHKKASVRVQKKNPLVFGFKIESAGIGKYYGFQVDKNNLYLDDKFFVHHNCGKTFVAFKCILSMPKGSNILFLAETVVREATVREDADKYEKFYGVHPLKDYNFKFATYQGAYKYKLVDYFPNAQPDNTIIVMDEILSI